ncbi:hypothetical protein O77CONTIG1_03317 [Leptolyngbya sp. O-77]|nr:hypothetical protein O77CONTIG1_03317 [Leptolyngbya sp. O-77]
MTVPSRGIYTALAHSLSVGHPRFVGLIGLTKVSTMSIFGRVRHALPGRDEGFLTICIPH